MKYLIGTRGSKLALVQANDVRDRLAKAYPWEEFEIRVIKTKGDRIQDKPLSQIGDKGLFVKEIEEDILTGQVDIGVHSMKDMPAYPANGLMFAMAWEREDSRDVLILREGTSLWELPHGAVIGTGSKRREFQLKRLRPDLRVVNIRGNVDTRLRKMEEEKLDGIVLAAAGLHRLGMQNKITCYLEAEEMISAPAQGILALEIREGETKLLEMLNALSDEEAVRAVEAERGFLQEIGGNCHVPVAAALRKISDGNYQLRAMFGNRTGSKQAYATVCGTNPKELAQKAAVQVRKQMAGTVYLVGGGPGDPGLVTVKGLQAIRKADCIVYDRLISPELLKEAKPDCEMIYVGKASHNHTMKQEEINLLLVRKSMEYEKIVRLKGGDVYVFGRGGEEGMALEENGVPFEVIPGISSAIAGPAYAGIPVTHRGVSQGFHVVTAHSQSDDLADLDFKAMANGKETCVFLMGLGKVKEIADRLIEAGMSCKTEAAVISCATTLEQRVCVSDLEHIAENVEQAKLISPAVIVIGEVVSLRNRLDFFEKRPLFGKRYLIPKIGEAPTRLGECLKNQGGFVDEIQVGTIVKIRNRLTAEQLKDVDWIIFTSKNGVKAAFECLEENGIDVRNLAGCRIAAVGKKTEESLKDYGIYADLVPNDFHGAALLDVIKRQLNGGEKVWYLKAENADSDLKEELEEYCRFEEIAVYENCAVELNLKGLRSFADYDGVLFTCASSVERLIGKVGGELGRCRKIYSIGPKTTACLKKYGVEGVLEAEESTYEGLVRLCAEKRLSNPLFLYESDH